MPPPNPRKTTGKAGGDPSIRRRKQAERAYGKPGAGTPGPGGPGRHADGGLGDDFHEDERAPRGARPGGPPGARPGGPGTGRPGGGRPSRPDAPEAPRAEAPRFDGEPVRLNRLLARAGVASRREADAVIAAGRVRVNGAVVTEMGVQVGPTDAVTVDGHPVGPVGLTYILMNKPTGAITTTSDERDRKTVMDLLDLPRHEREGLFPVGRLDRNTSGALLLTTDGDLAHRLMHPRYETVKTYLCATERPLTDDDLDRLTRGVMLDDGLARADNAQFVSPDRTVVALGLHEGRNRQVRRMIEALGTRVAALERIAYAGLTLEGLRRGKWRRLQPHEINALRRKVKLKAIVFGG
ncbi:MAG TPA: pseudouridine synthase [Rubricoccaceae bacterium]|jgi:23S rRNA pseudouridine2605 synthase